MEPGLSGLVSCARQGCLTYYWHPGVRRLAPALRIARAMLRLQCKRPHMGGGTMLAMQPPTAGDRLNRWPGGHQGRYRCMSDKRMHLLKAVIKVHRHALCLCSTFGLQGSQCYRLDRWPVGYQGRYMDANGMSSHVKGRNKSAWACSSPMQHFWCSRDAEGIC